MNTKNNKKKTLIVVLSVAIVIALVVLLITVALPKAAPPTVTSVPSATVMPSETTPTQTTIIATEKPVETTTAVIPTPSVEPSTVPVAETVDLPKDCLAQIEAGDVIVGNISTINADETHHALYDKNSDALLIVVFNEKTWIWTDSNCTLIQHPSAEEIKTLIEEKKQDHSVVNVIYLPQ